MIDMMKTFSGQAVINFFLTEKDIDDIMCCALEGGINYWCCDAEVVGEYLGEYGSEQISRGGKLKLYDAESDDVWELTLEKFLKGFKLWVENGRDEYGALKSDGGVDAGEIDAACADEIIQFALFDEIIFG